MYHITLNNKSIPSLGVGHVYTCLLREDLPVTAAVSPHQVGSTNRRLIAPIVRLIFTLPRQSPLGL